jgi:hypothetical protein
VESFNKELFNLKDMQQKYIEENEDLNYRIQEEGAKNLEL